MVKQLTEVFIAFVCPAADNAILVFCFLTLFLLWDTMRLAGVEDEGTKLTVFKIKAGPQLLQIFRNTKSQTDSPDAAIKPFSNAMHRLRSYFGSGSDVMLQRRKLAMMKQKPNESSLTFITRVGDTARLCEFAEDKEFEEIVGTIAEHAMCREVRVAALKMLSRKGTFSSLVDKVLYDDGPATYPYKAI